jgi:hypothetical protein
MGVVGVCSAAPQDINKRLKLALIQAVELFVSSLELVILALQWYGMV